MTTNGFRPYHMSAQTSHFYGFTEVIKFIVYISVERYYGTVIIIDYQLQIPLNFSNTVEF